MKNVEELKSIGVEVLKLFENHNLSKIEGFAIIVNLRDAMMEDFLRKGTELK